MINHATTEVFFDNLEVPAENLIGEEGRGFRYILDGMNAERILIAAEAIGDARWFIAKAAGYAKERVVFGRPIGQNQGIQFPIARAYASSERREFDGAARGAALRGRRAGGQGSKHGQAARLRGGVGRRRKPACKPTAGTPSPRNTMSSGSSARRGSTRRRRSRPISSSPISPSTSSACRAHTEPAGYRFVPCFDLISDTMTGSIMENPRSGGFPSRSGQSSFSACPSVFLMAGNWIATWFCIVVSAVFPVLRLIKTGIDLMIQFPQLLGVTS